MKSFLILKKSTRFRKKMTLFIRFIKLNHKTNKKGT